MAILERIGKFNMVINKQVLKILCGKCEIVTAMEWKINEQDME